jgi:rod shape-determining protein MreC
MKKLWLFIEKNYLGITFLIFEFYALFLFFKSNPYPRSIALNHYFEFYASVNAEISKVKSYFFLNKINRELSDALAQTMAFQPNSIVKKYGDNIIINDTIYLQRYVYLPANLVYNTTHLSTNTFIIDKGGLNGIQENMGVILPKGVVGIIKKVTPHFSGGYSILHPKVKISVKNKHSGHVGFLYWIPSDPSLAYIKDIPLHAPVQVNDTFITSGYSKIFPAGIPVGKVIKIDNDNTFKIITVQLFADLNSMDKVFVVKNIFKEEIESIEKTINENSKE